MVVVRGAEYYNFNTDFSFLKMCFHFLAPPVFSATGFQFSVISEFPPEITLLNLLRLLCSVEASVKMVTNGLKYVTLSVLFSFILSRELGKSG
jgi:hypothetical protein